MDLQKFGQQVVESTSAIDAFLNWLVSNPPAHLEKVAAEKDAEVWAETDCLECAHCCKTMTPAFSDDDVTRISHFLGLSEDDFRRKYLLQYTSGEWVGLHYPCSFLGTDNRCLVYEVRPANCAGFPYHFVQPFASLKADYSRRKHVCPATFKWLAKLQAVLEQNG